MPLARTPGIVRASGQVRDLRLSCIFTWLHNLFFIRCSEELRISPPRGPGADIHKREHKRQTRWQGNGMAY